MNDRKIINIYFNKKFNRILNFVIKNPSLAYASAVSKEMKVSVVEAFCYLKNLKYHNIAKRKKGKMTNCILYELDKKGLKRYITKRNKLYEDIMKGLWKKNKGYKDIMRGKW